MVINNAVTMHVDEIVTYCKATQLARGMMMAVKIAGWYDTYVHRTISFDDLAPLQGLSLHSSVTSSMPRHSRPPQYGPTHDLYLVLTP